ncbi:unnamed protein product [Calypogeia fissa]
MSSAALNCCRIRSIPQHKIAQQRFIAEGATRKKGGLIDRSSWSCLFDLAFSSKKVDAITVFVMESGNGWLGRRAGRQKSYD